MPEPKRASWDAMQDAPVHILQKMADDNAPLRLPPSPMRESDQDRVEREMLAADHRRRRYLRRLPQRYGTASLADLHPTEQNPDDRVSGWLAGGHQTLLLASEQPGLGKTHAAYAVGSQAVEGGLWVEAWTAMELLSALRPNRRDPEEPDRVLDDVAQCDVLILDDLGRENATAWAMEQVHHVVDVRLREGRRTVVTTNLTGDDMGQRYGYPLLDRVLDDAVIVKVTGASRRKVVIF